MADFAALLEERLLAACRTSGRIAEPDASPCLRAAGEHFAAGGSRFRARLCCDAATRLGCGAADAINAAVVCELLHNASLLQDDMLDRTLTRRGAPSAWARHGDTVAVCTGDLMLSAAYAVLCDFSAAIPLAEAVRLVHARAGEVIRGQACESLPPHHGEDTAAYCDRKARGKSASLLSLSLELPLLMAGRRVYLPEANAAASDFAVAYQIADDLDDRDQDLREGSANLVLLLCQRDGFTMEQATARAVELAVARLAAAERKARELPNHCAALLLLHSQQLRRSIAERASALPAMAGA